MVVLLAIAGGIAAVLLTRADDVSQELENENINILERAGTRGACEMAGGTFTADPAVTSGNETQQDPGTCA